LDKLSSWLCAQGESALPDSQVGKAIASSRYHLLYY